MNVHHAAPTFNLKAPRTAMDIIKAGIVDMPAVDAAMILRECRFEGQTRDLNLAGKAHINVLAEIMRRGQWRNFSKIDFALVDGRFYLVNGYHSLGAQAESGRKIKWVVAIHGCTNMDAVRAIYHSFDTNVRPRSTETILAAANLAEELGISRTTAKNLYSAVVVIASGFVFDRKNLDHVLRRMIDDRISWCRRFKNEAQRWEKATQKAPPTVRQRLLNQGAFAVALVCFRDQPAKAAEFWKGVADNDGLSRNDPRNTYLQSFAIQTPPGHALPTTNNAARAWNAFFEGRTLSKIAAPNGNRVFVDGTEFEG